MNLEKFLKDFIIVFLVVSVLFWVFDFVKKMFTKETAVAYWAMLLAALIPILIYL